MRRVFFAAVMVFALLGLFGTAFAVAATPDFSGTWRLDPARSDYGSRPKPRGRTEWIAHHKGVLADSSVTVRDTGDTLAFAVRYYTDGREATNTVMGQPVRTASSWQGKVLRLESHAKLLILDMVVIEQWELITGGRELVMTRESRLPMGTTKQRLVFVRP